MRCFNDNEAPLFHTCLVAGCAVVQPNAPECCHQDPAHAKHHHLLALALLTCKTGHGLHVLLNIMVQQLELSRLPPHRPPVRESEPHNLAHTLRRVTRRCSCFRFN